MQLETDIPITVTIELSRKQVSISELGTFKNGDILELNKGPAELVDLVVGGRIVAKGELVDIEGELGVRICSLVK